LLKKPIGKSYKSEVFYNSHSQSQEQNKNGLVNGVSKSYQEEKHNNNNNFQQNKNIKNSNPYELQDSLKIFRNNASSNPVQINPSKQVDLTYFLYIPIPKFIVQFLEAKSSFVKTD
jgi:hypothetical protein